MLSIALNEQNGNGHVAPEPDAKREQRNTIRRIRRIVRKDGIDLHHRAGEYYPVSVHRYAAIDVQQYGRRVGAILPIGRCVCRGVAWHTIDGVELCDDCAVEVRR